MTRKKNQTKKSVSPKTRKTKEEATLEDLVRAKTKVDSAWDAFYAKAKNILARFSHVQKRLRVLETRYREVLKAIHEYDGEDPLEYARRLCALGLDGGTKIGTVQWIYTARVLADPMIRGLCDKCSINLYGTENPRPGIMPCNVPGCPFEKAEEQDSGIFEELTHGTDDRADSPLPTVAGRLQQDQQKA